MIERLFWTPLATHVSDAIVAVPSGNDPTAALNNAVAVNANRAQVTRGGRYLSISASVAVGAVSFEVYHGRSDTSGNTTWALDTSLGVAGTISPVVGAAPVEMVVEAPGEMVFIRPSVNAGAGANTLTVLISAGCIGT